MFLVFSNRGFLAAISIRDRIEVSFFNCVCYIYLRSIVARFDIEQFISVVAAKKEKIVTCSSIIASRFKSSVLIIIYSTIR